LKYVVVHELATQDQEKTIEFYANRKGPDLAVRYLQAVQRAFLLLADKPHIGSSRRFHAPALQGIRWFPLTSPFQKHLVFYRAGRETIEFIRVLHASRDIEEILEYQL
jgi:toxin ParE1/3/4